MKSVVDLANDEITAIIDRMQERSKMKKPVRVQLRRKKGWRMPANTVKVGRPSKWGNPFKVGEEQDGILTMTREHAVRRFREEVEDNSLAMAMIVVDLRGKNLACWCPLNMPCHADVLLEIANK